MGVYDDTLAHLLAEMQRIDLLLRAQVVRARAVNAVDEQFQGLYISEEEVDRLLERPIGVPSWVFQHEARNAELGPALDRLHRHVAADAAESRRRGVQLRLAALAELFDLDTFAVDSLLICLAPELDLRYERIFAYLQDDVTKKRPSVDLVLGLLSPSSHEKLIGRHRFSADAPLLRHRLLEFVEDPSHGRQPLLAQQLKIDDRIASYLLGSDVMDARVRPFTRMLTPADSLDDVPVEGDLRRRLRDFARACSDGDLTVVYLQGPYGSGRRSVASALCGERQTGAAGPDRLIEVDLDQLAASGEASFHAAIPFFFREAALQGALLLFSGFDQLLTDGRRLLKDEFIRQLEAQRGIVMLAGELPWDATEVLRGASFIRVELSRPPAARRAELWAVALEGEQDAERSLDVQGLATKFRFSGGQIQDAIDTARTLARWRNDGSMRLTNIDLYDACRLQSNQKLRLLSRKITPRYQWNDIVLPGSRLQQLRDICNQVKYREQVYGAWGFDRKLSYGKGLSALFAGPSGTGKTMAAEIIAGELRLDLYKIDLSMVVSKYIGETEKNLSKIFFEAETSNAILFFDEADALFGKRSEVKDSHDRYANIEIGYLLQRIEEHDGVVILATNFRKNIDEAFVRRLHFTVEFPFPNEFERRRLWEVVWPEETPREPDVDFASLAARFEIAGGNIRNIVLAAAFLAADDRQHVTMGHLLRATQRELQKMGKIVAEGEFERVTMQPRPAGAGIAHTKGARPVRMG